MHGFEKYDIDLTEYCRGATKKAPQAVGGVLIAGFVWGVAVDGAQPIQDIAEIGAKVMTFVGSSATATEVLQVAEIENSIEGPSYVVTKPDGQKTGQVLTNPTSGQAFYSRIPKKV